METRRLHAQIGSSEYRGDYNLILPTKQTASAAAVNDLRAGVSLRREFIHDAKGLLMITIGSVSREAAAARFAFLAEKFAGRRNAIKEFTHRAPDFVFWISPDGKLHDARDAHRENVPRGFDFILDDEPDYGGFLRGRIASLGADQLIVVYCRPGALAVAGPPLRQFLRGLAQSPTPVRDVALVISDNGDLYGAVGDLFERLDQAR